MSENIQAEYIYTPVSEEEVYNLLVKCAEVLKDRIIDTTVFLRKAYKETSIGGLAKEYRC